jgi:hypothetical protein
VHGLDDVAGDLFGLHYTTLGRPLLFRLRQNFREDIAVFKRSLTLISRRRGSSIVRERLLASGFVWSPSVAVYRPGWPPQ